MKNNIYKLFLIALIIHGCSVENTEEDPIVDVNDDIINQDESVMTFTINGEDRTSAIGSPFAAFAEITTKNGDSIFFAFGVSAAFVDDNLRRWSFNTSYSSLDESLITQGTTISETELNRDDFSIVGEYDESLVRIPQDEILLEATHNKELFYTITISSIDEENQTVSGTFALDVMDVETQEIFEIRDGLFTNADYIEEEIVLDNWIVNH